MIACLLMPIFFFRKLMVVDNESCFLTFLDPHSDVEQRLLFRAVELSFVQQKDELSKLISLFSFRTLSDSYIKIADGIVILYAINNRTSFTSVTNYHEIISLYVLELVLVMTSLSNYLIQSNFDETVLLFLVLIQMQR
jgi:hypothetical protein